MTHILFSLILLVSHSPPKRVELQPIHHISPTLPKDWHSTQTRYAQNHYDHEHFVPPQAITGLW